MVMEHYDIFNETISLLFFYTPITGILLDWLKKKGPGGELVQH